MCCLLIGVCGCSSSFVVCWSLFADACCSLFDAHWSSLVVCCSVVVACCSLFVAGCSLLLAVYFVLFVLVCCRN